MRLSNAIATDRTALKAFRLAEHSASDLVILSLRDQFRNFALEDPTLGARVFACQVNGSEDLGAGHAGYSSGSWVRMRMRS